MLMLHTIHRKPKRISLLEHKETSSAPHPAHPVLDSLMVPKQRPYSTQNTGTTVGTVTVSVLAMVPKQDTKSWQPPSGKNI